MEAGFSWPVHGCHLAQVEPGGRSVVRDEQWMDEAIGQAASQRAITAPNPWVGAVVITAGGELCSQGGTGPVGQAHAEVVALAAAGEQARGGTLYVTLEPCAHHGRTPPCVDAIMAAGLARVVVGVTDPDPKVSGRGIAALRTAGISVDTGCREKEISEQLAPYLHHRRTGRPYVVLKVASTIDGRTAAADGTSQWITGLEARTDGHRLRAHSDAILVGAGTVRADDPALTVRHVEGRDPLRVVLGSAPATAKVHPCWERSGPLEPILDELGAHGVLQLLVEGGAAVAHQFHTQRLVDRYVHYLAPALMGGDDAPGVFSGPAASGIDQATRLRIVSITQLGHDLRIEMTPHPEAVTP
jgi:diaminohydroxyphosphoribosylaminopyrimidine deaminase / 5-amino-6-(5-phosphoribosylamino)uracil reductase